MASTPSTTATGPSVFHGTSRFELLRPLGEGGMGVVYEAFDRERNSRVALKTVRMATAESLARFKNEFRALQDLQHPNLVRLDELLESEGTWFFTMELVEGTDFVSYVRVEPAAAAGGEPLDTVALARGSQPAASVPSAAERRREILDGPTQPTGAVGQGAGGGPPPAPSPFVPVRGPREPIGFDEARLRRALAQLVQALSAVHGLRKVHRDVKPGNVLVTPDGRVVLLDFGLITDAFMQERQTHAVGTVSFMAPEQLKGESIGPAADWYAVGVTLYVALTGRRPYMGTADQIAELKQLLMPIAPTQLVEGMPEDLDQLCMDLLARDPHERPQGAEILARLGNDAGSAAAVAAAAAKRTGPMTMPPRAPFVGRGDELHALRAALADVREGHAVTVLLHGESGVGKSVLVKRFLDGVAGPDSILLAGRCYERESVPYKAIDEVMDALSRYLARLEEAEVAALLPERIAQVAEVFPTLRQVAAIEARAVAAAEGEPRVVDPVQTRVAVFAALRELWARLAHHAKLVVSIDDLQWADADSLALIASLMREPEAPPFLLCATVRTSVGAGALGPASLRAYVGEDVRDVQVDRLPPEAARELAEVLLGDTAGDRASALASEAGGHPLFIEALVRHRLEHPGERHGAVRLDEALVARTESLDLGARQLLEYVCVAGGPVAQEVCAHAAGVPFGEFVALVGSLRGANLVKTHGVRRGDPVEPYHDRVRETVIARLPAEGKRQVHARLGQALEDSGRGDPETLAHHFHEGGDPRRAARYATRAAEQSRAALAFERAARLYAYALALEDEAGAAGSSVPVAHQQKLRLGLADSLAYSGRGTEAAATYRLAAEHAADSEQRDLRWRAAEQLMLSGRLDEGTAEMRTVLASIGVDMPETPGRALVTLVANRAKLLLRGPSLRIRLKPPAQINPADLARMDILWSMAVGLSIVDPIRGADFQTRHIKLALEVGEPNRIACALAAEASYAAANGSKKRERTLYLVGAAEKLAEQVEDPNPRGYAAFAHAIVEYLFGNWRGATELCDRAVAVLKDRCVGVTWWIDSVEYFALECLWYLGDLAEMTRRTRTLLEIASARGDIYASTNLQIGIPSLGWLAADDVEGARRHIQEGMASWTTKGFHIQHEGRLHGEMQAALYAGEARAAYAQLMDTWKALSRSAIFTVQLARVAGHHERARTALAAAATWPEGSSERRRLVADARASARRIEKETTAWGDPLATVARAGACRLEGRVDTELELLAEAITGFAAADMSLFAAAARLRRAELIGGTDGATESARATAAFTAQGIKRVDRFSAMMLGF